MHPPCRSTAARSVSALFIALLFAVAPTLTAQDSRGTITGHVTDLRSGAPLAQVTIEIEGTRLGGTTGSEGQYRISGVNPGSYTLVARRIGYALSRKPVSLAAGCLGAVLPWLHVSRTRTKRMRRIEEQLPDAVDLMARALGAGGSPAFHRLESCGRPPRRRASSA